MSRHELIELRAGPVTAVLDGPDLRMVRLGSVELAQRIYVAVRDEVWNTIPAELLAVDVDQSDDSFVVEITARHRYDEIDFGWRGRIDGSEDGTIAYSLVGTAATSFRYAKIGFNVHHPLRECRGAEYRAHGPTGEMRGSLPTEIVPQRFENGRLTALFPDYDTLAIRLAGDVEVELAFEGDLFEMQDHRNWTDGNYKSYGTPMSVPWPFDATPGTSVEQRVILRLLDRPATIAPPSTETSIRIDEEQTLPLPAIGLGTTAERRLLSDAEIDRLRGLRPAHLRVDVELADDAWRAVFDRASSEAQRLGAQLEVAVFTTGDDAAIAAAADAIAAARVVRVLIFAAATGFSSTAGSTSAELVAAVRGALSKEIPVFGGTNGFFAEINRDPPTGDGADGTAFSINPQVHACDDRSLVENLPPQAEVVEMARSLVGARPIAVTPVTLVGRNGPYPGGPPEPDGLPGSVDVRQASLLGAAWTAMSVKHLAAAGAASITYYETTGWRGVIECDEGSPRPDLFPSQPGDAFPLYHVLADIGELSDAGVCATLTSDELRVDALALRRGETVHLLLANLTPERQRVVVGPLGGSEIRLRVLDEATAELARREPDRFRERGDALAIGGDGHLRLELEPYAYVRGDVA